MPLNALWQSPVDGHSSSSGSSESGSNSNSESETESELRELRRRLKRQRQTAKARAASLQSRVRKRLAKQTVLAPPAHPAERFKNDLHEDSAINRPEQGQVFLRIRRLRLLVSYLMAWCSAILNFIGSMGDRVKHTIVVGIVDDTNVRLSTVPSDAPNWRKSRVVAVMNCIQRFVVGWEDKPDAFCSGEKKHQRRVFNVHTPLVCLSRSDKSTLTSAFMSRLLIFLGKTAQRYHHFGMPTDLTKNVGLQGTVLVFDSLKTNVAMMKDFRYKIHEHHKQQQQNSDRTGPLCPLLGIFCLLHQLSLVRQPILLSMQGYWSSVVRLGHLFENQNFRSQFRTAMINVICDSFSFIPVSALPEGSSKWHADRLRLCRHSSPKKQRLEFHKSLMTWDNGDPSQSTLTHYCLGHCCSGRSHDDQEFFALLQVAKYYTLLLTYGFQVPLLYRWTHADEAIQFMKDRHPIPALCCFASWVCLCLGNLLNWTLQSTHMFTCYINLVAKAGFQFI